MKAFKLDEHPRITSGYKIPHGYFDALPEKINVRRNRQPKVIRLNRKMWTYSAAAVLVIGLGFALFNLPSSTVSPDADAIENYLAWQATTETLVVEALELEDIEQLAADYQIDEQTAEEVLLNTNLEQYIIQ